MLLVQLLFFCVLPAYILSWPWANWFVNNPPQKKVDFLCPHHCGEWGSESIHSLEWQFVHSLYEADKICDLIETNADAFISTPAPVQLLVPLFVEKPMNFQARWYQQALLPNPSHAVVISNAHDCYGDWAVFWTLEHIDLNNGEHLGKIFHRAKYTSCVFNGADPEDDDYDDLEDEHQNDPDWNRCLWSKPVQEEQYSFKNRIDFHNACLKLEQDLLEGVQDGTYRSVDSHAGFKKELYHRFSRFSRGMQEIRDNYYTIFKTCQRLHQAPSADYELALQQLQNGEYIEAVDQLRDFLDKVKLDSIETHLASNIYTSKGTAEVEICQYDEAIVSLSHAIQYDPSNHDAYFERAIAYFEKGQYDLSLQDYLTKGKDITFSIQQRDWGFQEFGEGFLKGGANGVKEASSEFLPSIYNSLCGVGNFLWLTVAHPIETPRQLVASTREFCNYLRTCDKAELAELLVPEMYELIVKWDELKDIRRGELMGYSLGKYGLDILLPVAAVKGVKYLKTYQEIRKAEKLCTLKTLAGSPKSKEALTQAVANWQNRRQAWAANVKLIKDQQTKHIPGSWNYRGERSIFTHSNPEKLLKENAGKGQKIRGHPGKPDYRERVDFEEHIGYHVDKITKEKTATTVGTIHYSKEGAHIVPARPKKK
jgi:tetratricopeptide (TPR) repeat protein